MTASAELEIFLVALPGLESVLCDEAREKGFTSPRIVPGGVAFRGSWPEVWRANLEIRGASKVLVRIGAIRVLHLAQLDKRARRFPWARDAAPRRAAARRRHLPQVAHLSCRGRRAAHRDGDPRRAWRARHARCRTLHQGPHRGRSLQLQHRHARASSCTSAATSRRSARRRCARPWRRCSCGNAAMRAPSRSWIRCADRAPSSSRRQRSRRVCNPAGRAASPSRTWPTFDAAALVASAGGCSAENTGHPLLRQRPRCRRHPHEPGQCGARRRRWVHHISEAARSAN